VRRAASSRDRAGEAVCGAIMSQLGVVVAIIVALLLIVFVVSYLAAMIINGGMVT
jgi:hypothetical protein